MRLPLFWLSLAFLGGIPLAASLSAPWWVWALVAFLLLAFAFVKERFPRKFQFLIPPRWGKLADYAGISLVWLMLALSLGALRYQLSLPNPADPQRISSVRDDGEVYVVRGYLVKSPDVRDRYANLWVACEEIRAKGTLRYEETQGLLVVRAPLGKNLHYGDLVVMQGKIQTPPDGEDFSYRTYLFHKGVYAYMPNAEVSALGGFKGSPLMRWLMDFREVALDKVYTLWQDPEASLLSGILLGVESGIPKQVAEAFKATGTTHIIAISGFNITIIAGLLIGLFSRFLRRSRAVFAAGAGIVLYTLLVGADAAVVRAAVMGGFSLMAAQVGRRQHGLNTLMITAALMALFSPHIVWDVGFQLSFMATLGLILYAQPLQDWFVRLASRRLPLGKAQKLAKPVGEYFLFTLAAQVTTLPVLAYHFQQLSLSSLLVNPLILPAQPPLMIIGGAALIMGLILPPLGMLLAPFAWFFAAYTIRLVEIFAALPAGVLVLGRIDGWLVVCFYCLLFGATIFHEKLGHWWKERAAKPWRERAALPALVALGVVAAFLWRGAFTAPDGFLHLTLMDAGGGLAMLIQTPSGHVALLGGGESPSRLSDALGRRLPLFRHTLDFLIVPSVQAEDIGALPTVINRYQPEHVLWAGVIGSNWDAVRLRRAIQDAGVQLSYAEAGQVLDFGDGVTLRVVRKSKRGALLSLEMGAFRALLPLGITLDDLQSLEMGRKIGNVSVLLLSEHGYAPANPPQWIEHLNPQLVLLPVAADEQNGLPDAEVLDALDGYALLRSDQNGWVHLTTDGESLWVAVEKR